MREIKAEQLGGPRPKLIGIVRIAIPWMRTCAPEEGLGSSREYIPDVAFDTDGNPWGLVMRETVIDRRADGSSIGRVSAVRWEQFPALEFSEQPFDPEKWHVPRG